MAAGILLQGVWVLGLFAFVRQLGFDRRLTTAAVVFVSFTGQALVNDVYTWPKLAMAGFVLGAWAVGTSPAPHWRDARLAVATVLWLLAYLCHGGVIFSLVGAVPLVVARLGWPPRLDRVRRPTARDLAAVAVPIVALALPWIAYQQLYQPPADRLLKWHLAGVQELDDRSVPEAIVDEYGDLGIDGVVRNRVESVERLVTTDLGWIDVRPSTARERRVEEFFHPGTALGAGLVLASAAAAFAVVDRRRDRRLLDEPTRRAIWWFVWSTVAWVVLIFEPDGITVHHGSLAVVVGLLGLLAAIVARRSAPVFVAAAALQALHLVTTWMVRPTGGATRIVTDTLDWRAVVLTAACAVALAFLLVRVATPQWKNVKSLESSSASAGGYGGGSASKR
jgi:hypothetical protein